MKTPPLPNVPRRLLEYFVKHWVISALIPTLPGWFGLVLRYYGKRWGLAGADDSLTWLGALTLGGLFLVCTGFALFKSKGVQFEQLVRANGEFIMKRLVSCVNSVTRAKLDRVNTFIRDPAPITCHPFEDITQPEDQIRNILENIQGLLSDVMDIERDRIGMSVICLPDRARPEDWQWIVRLNGDGDMELPKVATHPQTSFHHVLSNEDDDATLFYPDKRVAAEQRRYVMSPKDRTYDMIGSILVHRISIKSDRNVLLPAAISISTYGKQLCEQTDDEAKRKVLEILLPCFELRLRLELSMYYIKHILIPATASLLPPAPVSVPPVPQRLPH